MLPLRWRFLAALLREPGEVERRISRAYAGFRQAQLAQGHRDADILEQFGHFVDQSVGQLFIAAGQAFHWFDGSAARDEFRRILKPRGWVVLIWNERHLDSSPFLRAYEELLLEFGTDYEQVRHENADKRIASFFAPEEFKLATFENLQEFDFEGLKGRLLSSSYIPAADHPDYTRMLDKTREIFVAHQRDDRVNIAYDTKIYFGHLPNQA